MAGLRQRSGDLLAPLVNDGYANQIGGEIRTGWGEPPPDGGWEHDVDVPDHAEGRPPSPEPETVARNHFEAGRSTRPGPGTYVTWVPIRTAWRTLARAERLGLPAGDESTTDAG